MASISISGDTSGSITLAAPAVAGTNTLTLPANTGTIITTASSGQVIPKAALPTGSVLQVVQTAKTDSFTTTSTSYVDITGLSLSITPSSASSKILVLYNVNGSTPGDTMHGYLTLIRNSTEIFKADTAGSRRSATSVINTATQQQFTYSAAYLDSPATTSATTYKVQALSSNGTSLSINRSARDADLLAYDGRTVSSIIALEIAA